MGGPVQLLRSAVVRASSVPPLGWLGGQIYDAALAALTARLRAEPEIAGILLRRTRGAPRAIWSPGLSDIDLTVVVDDLAARDMVAFVARFRALHRRLRRCVPMLGEIDVVVRADFGDHLGFAPASTKRHHVVWLRDDAAALRAVVEREAARPRVARDLLRNALLRYAEFALPRTVDALRRPSALAVAIAHRCILHVRERLPEELAHAGATSARAPSGDVAARLAETVRDLARACARHPRGGGGPALLVGDAGREPTRWSGGVPAGATCVVARAFVSGAPQVALVVDDDDDDDAVLRGLHALVATGAGVSGPCARFTALAHPLLATRTIWRALGELLPFEAGAIVHTGAVVAGDPRALDELAPTRDAFVHAAPIRYAALLALRHDWRGPDAASPRETIAHARAALRSYAAAARGAPVPMVTGVPVDAADAGADDRALVAAYEALDDEIRAVRAARVIAAARPASAPGRR